MIQMIARIAYYKYRYECLMLHIENNNLMINKQTGIDNL